MTNIFWHKLNPDDLINVKLGDWIQGAGFVETHFELNFIQSFGKFYKTELCKHHTDRYSVLPRKI